jgi:1,4-alpha-glucan branching enzyme
MALTVQATAFGLMMIWMGAEIGEYKEKTPGSAKIDWSLIDDREDRSNDINKEQLQYYKDIIRLRQANSALTSPNIEFVFEQVNDQIMVWHRWTDSSSDRNHLIIVCNWSKETTYETYQILNIPYNGKWYEWLNDDKEYIVDNNRLIIDNFLDHTARIFVYESRKKQ